MTGYHAKWIGNEEADKAAKQGARSKRSGWSIPLAICSAKSQMRIKTNKDWQDRWKSRVDCRQTKYFYPNLDPKKAKELIPTSCRKDYSVAYRTCLFKEA
jgi:hypothetical protein